MENLEDIKVGDKVIVSDGFRKRVDTVTRLTKNLIVVGRSRFNKSNGFEYGGRGYCSPHIVRATPEMIAEIEEERRRNDLLAKLKGHPWNKLTTEELEKVYRIINVL